MSIVAHKYTPGQISDDELEKTFAARWHTLDFLVDSLRRQTGAQTPSSFVLAGPRGSGKSTLLRMLRLRIRRDAELSGAWLPVSFPEEQFDVASLRDLFAGALKILAQNSVPAAKEWLDKVEQEQNDEQSEDLSISGLREISRREGKRLILFVENLDQLLGSRLRPRMKGTLRRLLMTDPFLILIGSTVHVFDSLRSYDEAFFNYFQPVPLERLTEEEVLEMLRNRARFDENAPFKDKLARNEAKIKEIAYLSGGNPRFVLMIYELLSGSKVTTAIQQLRRLVDELTPLFKHELESLPEQQRKIVHALMEKGGTASPKDLTGPTRLTMNSVSTQLSRLKDAQILEVRGGGKGRPAFYSVPDRLFSIWYKMRYLRQERRRIELFVEVLEVWFDAEERHQLLQSLVSIVDGKEKRLPRETADAAEYFAASLAKTKYGESACDLMIRSWLNCGEVHEAAKAYLALQKADTPDEKQALSELAAWCRQHRNPEGSVMVLREAARDSDDQLIKLDLAMALAESKNWGSALAECNSLMNRFPTNTTIVAAALFSRAVCKRASSDHQGALADFTAVIESPHAPKELIARSLYNRALTKEQIGDYRGELADYTTLLALPGVPKDQIAMALVNRAATEATLGNFDAALADCTAVIESPETTREQLRALAMRFLINLKFGKTEAGFEDWKTLLANPDSIGYFPTPVVSMLFLAFWISGHEKSAVEAVEFFLKSLAKLDDAERAKSLLNFLADIAEPSTQQSGWLFAWKRLTASQPAEVMERLEVLKPVAAYLEKRSDLILDALPPEQREFVERVLAKFKPSPKP